MSWEVTDEPAWRSKPPTDRQVRFLREKDMVEYGRFKRPKTRGEASNRIGRYISRGLEWEEWMDDDYRHGSM